MAKEDIDVTRTLELIRAKKSFLLSGGAGSGKTYSLTEVIKGIYANEPRATIACVTFTNVAVAEIRARAPFDNIYIATIHEFLWEILSGYQNDLKESLARLIGEGSITSSGNEDLDLNYFHTQVERIEYREWVKVESGVISHDELIKLAVDVFKHSPLLAIIVADRFNYVFVDEYQDTFSEVVEILLEHVHKVKRPNVIGFFGDSMQAIYDRSSPDAVKSHIQAGDIEEVIKQNNRRNPTNVLNVINKLRNDGLMQQQSEDERAPNYLQEGKATFLYSMSDSYEIDAIKNNSVFNDWTFGDADKTKELYLVKKFIAREAHFQNLMDIYVEDGIIKYKDAIKLEIKRRNLSVDETKTFGEIIDIVNKNPSPAIEAYIQQNPDLLEKARQYPYEEFKRLRLDADLFMGSKKVSEYDERDRGQRCDELMSHLTGLQELIYLYESGEYNEFIRKTRYKINSIKDKRVLKENIDRLIGMKGNSIEEVIGFAHESGLWPQDDNLREFKLKYAYRWKRVMAVRFNEIIGLYDYIENRTPYSTQHSVKGAEYDDVLVVLDNGGWSNYNFKSLFENSGTMSVRERTRKMFYVCCSRSKRNLVVFFHKPSETVLRQAEEWFGKENVRSI